MANWINFNVVGGSNADGSVLAPEQDGDNLLLAESVIGISTNTSATALAVVMQLTGGLTATALVSTPQMQQMLLKVEFLFQQDMQQK